MIDYISLKNPELTEEKKKEVSETLKGISEIAKKYKLNVLIKSSYRDSEHSSYSTKSKHISRRGFDFTKIKGKIVKSELTEVLGNEHIKTVLEKFLKTESFQIDLAIPYQKFLLPFINEDKNKQLPYLEIKEVIYQYECESEEGNELIEYEHRKKYLIETKNNFYGIVTIDLSKQMKIDRFVLTKDKNFALFLFKNNLQLTQQNELVLKLYESLEKNTFEVKSVKI